MTLRSCFPVPSALCRSFSHSVISSKRSSLVKMPAKGFTLTPEESLFRLWLLDLGEQISSPPPVLRWTGGWVRDKLLGVPSHDIDVAVNNMTGMQFVKALQEVAKVGPSKYEVEAEKLGLKTSVNKMHQIAANPEKSKHLETVTTKLFGFDVDFVNLRKEVYAEDSRNPQMEFGTPEEDALRRDATVNALFYNLTTDQVEDFTQMGLRDLRDKIFRTPLEPYQTFKDDPLRVLRLIRFASRYSFELEESTFAAMKESSIHEALRAKISRERVGVELGKMVSGPDPYRALMLIHHSNLNTAVFADPADTNPPESSHRPRVYTGLKQLYAKCTDITNILKLQDDQALSWILAAYVPWHDRGKAASLAAREGIKATNQISRVIDSAVKNKNEISHMVHEVCRHNGSRSLVGLCIRMLGSSWRFHILYSLLCDFAEQNFEEVVGQYQALLRYIEEQDLIGAAELIPILDGNEIRKTLEAKPGPWLSKAVNLVAEWQFQNPNKSQDEAKEMLRSKKSDLGFG